ncbi:Putative helicase (fragment) [uncultured Mycobacterium sp.]|uniref:Putative helicase n=1 Tax=uncultured Mycobacterium sp. TaxID=171292 RepID=A0A1Y5PKU8_9MYCO
MDRGLEPVASARSWYASWTAKALGVGAAEGAVLARLLFGRLHRRDIIGEITSASGAQIFHLPANTVVAKLVDDADVGAIALMCDTCRNTVYSYPQAINQLDGAPCLVARCSGTQRRDAVDPDNFYRQMYALTDIRRVVAREHTSLLDDAVRLRYETEFKQPNPPPNAPSVLVATPTLEMGIDIGDLSAVLLSSLPGSVASYLQRVGRAGRLTGNALALAYVTGRGDQLPRFKRPEDTINGAVRPPATYLEAEEILRRQFTASVADVLARDPNAPHPRTPRDALGATTPGTFLGELLALAATRGEELVNTYLAGFSDLDPDVATRLREFPAQELPARCHKASQDWNRRIETLNHRRAAAEKALPELQGRSESPAATEDDKREYRTAKSALGVINKQLAEQRSEYWISALEVHGLFPNYTLLDDSVLLSVSVNWRNPETQDYENSEFELVRGSSAALREFAPGSTFYAHGFAINIDAVDVGASGEDIRTWVCCPKCGYVKELDAVGAAAPTKCPRCGSPSIADISQRLPIAELTNVSALIRREEAAIDDSAEDRRIERFVVVPLADINSAGITRHWYVENLGLGAKHLRDVRLRWINMGRSGSGGSTRLIAGEDIDAALFRVCAECGKLDTLSGANRPSEHRPWCSLRKSPDEATVNIGLARSMTTEGLVLRLPAWITLGDNFAIPSLSAAVLLGLREKIGGNPDHLQIVPTVDPRPNGQNVDALLVHDVVPGGTGYLNDFTDPATVWDLLHQAWKVLRDCPCQHDGRLACERCLLPFTRDVKRTSRAVAERHLAGLLAGREFKVGEPYDVPEEMPWTITLEETIADDPESHLEKRFRVVLAERLKALGATVVEKPSHNGVAWEIALGATNRWTLRPQEYVLGCQPDFVLTSAQGGVPPTAVFTDGWIYHASAGCNRLADDAEKRRNLRDAGYQVIAVTHHDLEGAPVDAPSLRPEMASKLVGMAGDQLSKGMVDVAFKTAVDLLVSWIASPSREARERLANWMPALGLMSTSQNGKRSSASDPLHLIALDVPTGTGDTFIARQGGFAFAARMPGSSANTAEIAVVLDDDDNALTLDSRDAWRDWLRWSNLLNFRSLPATITTRSHAPHLEHTGAAPAADSTAHVDLTGPWQEIYALVEHESRSLIIDLAYANVAEPTVGEEVHGIPIEIAWPSRKIVIRSGLTAEECAELTAGGWTVCDPDAESIKAALHNGEA